MVDKILRAKHWQIFAVLFGIPLVFYIMWIVSFMRTIATVQTMNNLEMVTPEMLFGDMKYIFYFAIAVSILLMFWQWSVAVGLQQIIAANVKFNLRIFRILIFIPLVFTAGYMYWMQSFFDQMMYMPMDGSGAENMPQMMSNILIVSPISLLAMVCSFYIMYVCAKSIKTAETHREVTLGEIVGDIVLIWFLPIGIWFLQPRINALMHKENESDLMNSLIE